ncbi:MAG: mdtA 2 [Xanthobacteraceae bacterium]|nr:mdtA 2 [Xanthobacteraceae bacterium]
MTKRTWKLGVALVVIAIGVAAATKSYWSPQGAVAQAPVTPQNRTIPVEVGQAVKKKTPVLIEALGTVTPVASVAIKSRVDNEIVGVHFNDGALVNKGDLLLTLDSRAVQAQIAQAEGTVAKDQALLEGAERDVRRYTDLVAKNATPIINLDNAKTQVASQQASIKADSGALENLRVQFSYYTIRAPISGRISAAAVKVGNYVRAADLTPIATIIQQAPIYVSFTVPQRSLPEIRQALANETATIEVIVPGATKHAQGAVTMVENTVDVATGTAMIRATMPNEDGLLWPGTLVNAQLKVREEEGITVPSAAVQVSQQGSYVFTVKDNVAKVQAVKVARIIGPETVIETGLAGGETVVTDGHLQLTNNARVTIRANRAGT